MPTCMGGWRRYLAERVQQQELAQWLIFSTAVSMLDRLPSPFLPLLPVDMYFDGAKQQQERMSEIWKNKGAVGLSW